MTTVFTCGAICSAVTGVLHDAYGWTGVCWFGTALPLLGFGVWALRLRPSQAPDRTAVAEHKSVTAV
ncbi:hypothetical protein [uncultured Jatrophihabitans sp.]|uniref:hypothetical protein n=1 Tax=uncultured Jatrophihabitans sp. TaxID=1610747 RepID=UPI0035CB105B